MRCEFIVAMVLAVTLGSGTPASAQICDCPEWLPVADEFARSAAVFSGRVLGIEVLEAEKLVLFERYDCWKGANDTIIEVLTPRDGALCGYGFQSGVEYLVYATAEGSIGSLYTYLCTRTRPLGAAAADLAQLGTPVCTVPVTPSTWSAMKRLYDLNPTR